MNSEARRQKRAKDMALYEYDAIDMMLRKHEITEPPATQKDFSPISPLTISRSNSETSLVAKIGQESKILVTADVHIVDLDENRSDTTSKEPQEQSLTDGEIENLVAHKLLLGRKILIERNISAKVKNAKRSKLRVARNAIKYKSNRKASVRRRFKLGTQRASVLDLIRKQRQQKKLTESESAASIVGKLRKLNAKRIRDCSKQQEQPKAPAPPGRVNLLLRNLMTLFSCLVFFYIFSCIVSSLLNVGEPRSFCSCFNDATTKPCPPK